MEYGILGEVFDAPATMPTVPAVPRIRDVKRVVGATYGVSSSDLESVCRKRQFALPRQYAMYLCRSMTKCSYPQIGRMFGNRDHTTVLFAFRKVQRLLQHDPNMEELMSQFRVRIMELAQARAAAISLVSALSALPPEADEEDG